jgi:uncharacterized membrane protein YphA (DoxX/SURF4 family)
MSEKNPAPAWLAPALLAARVAVGAMFLSAGVSKAAAGPGEFAVVIESYAILPDALLMPAAAILPWIEAFLGMCLVSGYALAAASTCAAVFLGMFIAAVGSTIVRRIPLDSCGCFGGNIHLTPWQAVGVDSLLLAAALWIGRSKRSPLSLDGWISEAK